MTDVAGADFDIGEILGLRERDPHSVWKRRRAQAPVMPGVALPHQPPPELTALIAGSTESYTAYTYEAVQTVLRNPADFSSSGYQESIGLVLGRTILGMDPPEHMAHRSLVAQAFRLKTMQDWEGHFIGPLVNELIDSFVGRGHADLVQELTFLFPVQVIAAILGLPRADWPSFQKLSAELIDIMADADAGLRASAALRDYFADVLAQRRSQPQDDLISVLAEAEVDGARLSDEEIFSFLRLLLPAGAETTFRSSSNLIYALLTHPEQYAAVVADRGLLPQTMEEGLRYEPPLNTIARTVTRDLELCGVPLPAGAIVNVCLGSANRDEALHENADEFDIFRSSKEHISFATGPHMCLGMHLARAETRVVLSAIMDRLPDLQLDTRSDPHIQGVIFRSPNALPVQWSV